MLLGYKEGEEFSLQLEENIHQLPINRQYQFYGDLYAYILSEGKYCPIDLEIFENIKNALYLNMEDESESDPELYSSDEELELPI